MSMMFDQVLAAFRGSRLTVAALLELSGLEIDRTQLQRKLKRQCKTTDDELEALARALKIQIAYVPQTSKEAT